MKVENIQLEHIVKILTIWESVGGNVPHDIKPDSIMQDLLMARENELQRHAIGDGYRIGSKWTPHSKLAFRVDRKGNLELQFIPNLDIRIHYEAEIEEEAYQAAKEFSRKIMEYFTILDEQAE